MSLPPARPPARPPAPTWVASLRHRSDLLREIRSRFDAAGFFEVQPPCLSGECVVDAYLDPISIAVEDLGLPVGDFSSSSGRLFLQTSPESAMKRMLVDGGPSIYSIGPVFRRGERGSRHNLEFTMLEWYEVGADASRSIERLADLARLTLRQDGVEVITYRDLFRRQLGVDPLDCELAELQKLVAAEDETLSRSIGPHRDGLLDVLMSVRIEPTLGHQCPTIVTRYPLTQAALAKRSSEDPDCAERFELFAAGVELANGYDELLDPDELVRRFEANNRIRQAAGREVIPMPSRFIEAMRRGLPPCSGVALGIDRLLMVRLGMKEIEDVLPLPIERA